ncbi:Ferric reductase transmembrane component 3 [Pyrenophora seminiperda CCB06]|uniref:ferric-chelate reductase (NADPH) n=1 Tax=Pyrenophora seminiperda CCB06 TaxID=1302712 RepID=A0A3M7MIK5_9PLEO|nr:Ferric reductase transmembrane component 3 [Pyrenophora seminiperda CCB06]
MDRRMSMGGMSMGSGPALKEWPKFYYAVVASAVAIATLVNLYNYLLYRQRLSAARRVSRTPSKPTSWFALGTATVYALAREASNFSVRIPLRRRMFRLPTIGKSSLVLANIVVLVVLCYHGLDLKNQFTREGVGYRCGVITISQLPIIFLLAGKNNIIGWLSGVSYERLNWLHRWCARCMLLTATMHMGWFFSAWAPYDYIGYQLKHNRIAWKGLAAWCTLVWIVFSSMTPIRGWSYEIFVIQHIVSFAVLLGFIHLHTPVEMNGYIWAPVAIFFFDRVFRGLRLLYINVSLFHSKKQRQSKGLWACKAEFTPLPHNTTRIVVQNPPISWTPGQHVYLSCHSVAALQSHPFTVASVPEDGKMEFYIKAEKGGTRRFFNYAEKSNISLEVSKKTLSVTIEGPYGCIRPLRQFDSVVLIAGSTGGTFTMPLLRDLIQGWRENVRIDTGSGQSIFKAPIGAVTRHVRFVWIVKSRGQLSWFSEQLSSIYTDYQALQSELRDIKLEMSVYVTCDESFTEEHKSLLSGITAPKPNPWPRQQGEHGTVQYRLRPPSTADKDDVSKPKKTEEQAVQELASSDTEPQQPCTCYDTVDETDPPASKPPCCCSKDAAEPSTPTPAHCRDSSSATTTATTQVPLHPAIALYAGRPKSRDIIRRSLEQALGESAVVVCGPQNLVADVKHDVVYLSDERAVHKGTGAQGIYLHTESFGW